jgi:PIN domain nuclease of toxin-antitoxin system
MRIKHVVDTHALVWHLEGNPRLGDAARAVMSDPHSDLVLPFMALVEACWMAEHGKTSIPSAVQLLAAVDSDRRVTVLPLHRIVLDRSLTMTSIREMHDRLIVATALVLADAGETVVLLTKDDNIRRSGLVSVAW